MFKNFLVSVFGILTDALGLPRKNYGDQEQQYAGHERSEESIEAAFEKILMESFRQRKKTKINLKSRLKKKVEESPPWVQNLLNYVELPTTDVILRRLFLFAFMGGWSIMNSAESGPAFQVAISLAACIYFRNEKMKSLARASIKLQLAPTYMLFLLMLVSSLSALINLSIIGLEHLVAGSVVHC